MRLHLGLLLVVSTTMSGCAYLTTYTRGLDLKDNSYAMDVKQRVVFSTSRKYSGDLEPFSVVCAEPSPDALTVLGASGGLSINDGKKVANAAAALSESGAFVGLRTQSIQLLRDAMYRLCEGWASGAVSPTEFNAMQRRYQSTMMGLIAIEQLTGPVVAGQALLTTAVGSQGGAGAGDTGVGKAQEQIDATTSASLTAESELDKAKVRDTKAKQDLQVVRDKIKTEEGKKEPSQEAITSVKEQLPTAEQEAKDASLALVDARRRAEDARSKVAKANEFLRQAQSRAQASISGGGALSSIAESQARSNEALTKGVVDIVEAVNRSYTKDACLALMTELVRDPSALLRIETSRQTQSSQPNSGPGANIAAVLGTSLDVCARILAVEAARAEAQAAPK